eukprot:TRINITY_DN3717_c7_g1_i1.p1 TRINITY_DN3717_c7_g1~~TRINITY_DN3717_c7_g1_i1.p1  ORF type:complete len:735 (+),score=154.77 TRINITY_DN3717_c7_g1_i1:85-2289(+)
MASSPMTVDMHKLTPCLAQGSSAEPSPEREGSSPKHDSPRHRQVSFDDPGHKGKLACVSRTSCGSLGWDGDRTCTWASASSVPKAGLRCPTSVTAPVLGDIRRLSGVPQEPRMFTAPNFSPRSQGHIDMIFAADARRHSNWTEPGRNDWGRDWQPSGGRDSPGRGSSPSRRCKDDDDTESRASTAAAESPPSATSRGPEPPKPEAAPLPSAAEAPAEAPAAAAAAAAGERAAAPDASHSAPEPAGAAPQPWAEAPPGPAFAAAAAEAATLHQHPVSAAEGMPPPQPQPPPPPPQAGHGAAAGLQHTAGIPLAPPSPPPVQQRQEPPVSLAKAVKAAEAAPMQLALVPGHGPYTTEAAAAHRPAPPQEATFLQQPAPPAPGLAQALPAQMVPAFVMAIPQPQRQQGAGAGFGETLPVAPQAVLPVQGHNVFFAPQGAPAPMQTQAPRVLQVVPAPPQTAGPAGRPAMAVQGNVFGGGSVLQPGFQAFSVECAPPVAVTPSPPTPPPAMSTPVTPTAAMGSGAAAALAMAAQAPGLADDTRYSGKGGRKLFVGQLPKDISKDDLAGLMSQFGPIEDMHICRDRDTGRGTGAAFVVLSSREAAHAAILYFDGKVRLIGVDQPMRVRLAEGEVSPELDVKLFVGHIPGYATEESLVPLFQQFGTLLEIVILKNRVGKNGERAAFVRFGSRKAALDCIAALNKRHRIEGSEQPMSVRLAHTEADKRRRRGEDGSQATSF